MRSLSDTLFFTKVCCHLRVEIINKQQQSFTLYKWGIITVWCVVLVIRLVISTSVRSLSLMQSGPMRLDLDIIFPAQYFCSNESIILCIQ